MFNPLINISHLFLLSLGWFFLILFVRNLFIKKKLWMFLYYGVLGLVLFVLALVGGSVQNDAYERFHQFAELEKNSQLAYAKEHPEEYSSMLAIDLAEFENTEAFRAYLKKYDAVTDNAEARFMGWFYAFFADLSVLSASLVLCMVRRIRKKE